MNKEQDKMDYVEGPDGYTLDANQRLIGTTTSDVDMSKRSLQDMFTLIAIDLEKSLQDKDDNLIEDTKLPHNTKVITTTRKSKEDDYFPRDEEFRKAWGIK